MGAELRARRGAAGPRPGAPLAGPRRSGAAGRLAVGPLARRPVLRALPVDRLVRRPERPGGAGDGGGGGPGRQLRGAPRRDGAGLEPGGGTAGPVRRADGAPRRAFPRRRLAPGGRPPFRRRHRRGAGRAGRRAREPGGRRREPDRSGPRPRAAAGPDRDRARPRRGRGRAAAIVPASGAPSVPGGAGIPDSAGSPSSAAFGDGRWRVGAGRCASRAGGGCRPDRAGFVAGGSGRAAAFGSRAVPITGRLPDPGPGGGGEPRQASAERRPPSSASAGLRRPRMDHPGGTRGLARRQPAEPVHSASGPDDRRRAAGAALSEPLLAPRPGVSRHERIEGRWGWRTDGLRGGSGWRTVGSRGDRMDALAD